MTFRDDTDAARARVAAAERDLRELESEPCSEEYQQLRARLAEANTRIATVEEELRLVEAAQAEKSQVKVDHIVVLYLCWLALLTILTFGANCDNGHRHYRHRRSDLAPPTLLPSPSPTAAPGSSCPRAS